MVQPSLSVICAIRAGSERLQLELGSSSFNTHIGVPRRTGMVANKSCDWRRGLLLEKVFEVQDVQPESRPCKRKKEVVLPRSTANRMTMSLKLFFRLVSCDHDLSVHVDVFPRTQVS